MGHLLDSGPIAAFNALRLGGEFGGSLNPSVPLDVEVFDAGDWMSAFHPKPVAAAGR